jgi:cohesin loading factor subunit SCC2
VNKPEWPAAELLLTLLGNLLVKNLGNKGLEVSMRVASLEYLGVAAARLRKDAVSAQKKMDTIDRIIADIRAEEERFGDVKKEPLDLNCEEDKVEFLQRLLLDYLAVNGQSDPALMQARHFYISSWWRSAQTDISKSIHQDSSNPKPNRGKKKKKKKSKVQQVKE